jgi:predicted nucleotidyltransferase
LFQKESPPRVKPLLYVYRVLLTGIHLMRTGRIEANLIALNEDFRLPYLGELVSRKVQGAEKSKLETPEFAFHQAEDERLVAQLETAAAESTLPDARPPAGTR